MSAEAAECTTPIVDGLHATAVAAVREARARVIGRIQYAGVDLHDVLALVRRCAHELGDLDFVLTLRVGSQAECDRACVRAWLAVDAWRRAKAGG